MYGTLRQYGTKTDLNLPFPNMLDLDPDLRLTNTAFYKKSVPITVFDFKSGFRIRIRIKLSCWIRIRIQIADPDPDPGGQK